MTNYQNPRPDEYQAPYLQQSPPPVQTPAPFQPQYSPYGTPVPMKDTSGMAVAALILGLVGIGMSWFTFGIPSILAIIFGFVGMKQTENNIRQGRGMALTGLISGGAVFVIFMIITLLFALGVFGTIIGAGTGY